MNKLYSLLAVLGIAVLIGAGCSQATTEEETTVTPEPAGAIETTVTVTDEATAETTEEEEETSQEATAEEETEETDTTEEPVEETQEATTEESTEQPTEEPAVEEAAATEESSGYTLEDVASHDSASDCWIVLDGTVYDVTDYVSSHPGGSAILRGCGEDATALFEAQGHSAAANAIKAKYEIGSLQ